MEVVVRVKTKERVGVTDPVTKHTPDNNNDRSSGQPRSSPEKGYPKGKWKASHTHFKLQATKPGEFLEEPWFTVISPDPKDHVRTAFHRTDENAVSEGGREANGVIATWTKPLIVEYRAYRYVWRNSEETETKKLEIVRGEPFELRLDRDALRASVRVTLGDDTYMFPFGETGGYPEVHLETVADSPVRTCRYTIL